MVIGGCDGGGPGEVCVVNQNLRPMLHLCTWTQLDGKPCGRRHAHLDHREAMKDLRYERVMGATAKHQHQPGAMAMVSANQNVWLQSTQGKLWAFTRANAAQEKLDTSDYGEPYTQYSADGNHWSQPYYDRSDESEQSEDDDEESLQDSLLSDSGEFDSLTDESSSQNSSATSLNTSGSSPDKSDTKVSPSAR